jgi:hypothetical protein
MTALVVAHNRLTTDKPHARMAADNGTSLHSGHEMESIQCYTVQEGDHYGNLELGNLETDDQCPTTPLPSILQTTEEPQVTDLKRWMLGQVYWFYLSSLLNVHSSLSPIPLTERRRTIGDSDDSLDYS